MNAKTRPMPDDFPEHAWTKKLTELAVMYKAGQTALTRWRAMVPRPKPKLIQAPKDFASQATKMTVADLRRHYGVGEKRIKAWIVQTCAEPLKRKRQLPEDFAELAPTMSKTALLKHYRCDWDTVTRWLAEANVQAMAYNPAPPPSRGFAFRGHGGQRVKMETRINTMFDDAADVLRRERWTVFPCGPTGKYMEKGLHWRVGNVICTPDELLQRADRVRRKAG